MTKLFVYGTFKRGERNHGYLDGTFISKAVTMPRYHLYEHPGGFPVLVNPWFDRPRQQVEGEIWEIDRDTFRVLDHLEGAYFERRYVYLSNSDDRAAAYIWKEESLGTPERNGLTLCKVSNWSGVK